MRHVPLQSRMFNLSTVTALNIEMEHADFERTLSNTETEAAGEHYLFDLVVDAITSGVKVKVVDSFPDLKVQIVSSFPDRPGKWQIVNSFPLGLIPRSLLRL